MAQPYVGEIRMFGGNFPPVGWMFCDGSMLPISEYEVLFQLIGTIYGGDGQSTFALPDLRGRIPIHMGQGAGLSSYQIGELAGVENVTLTVNQIPAHSHMVKSSNAVGNSKSGSQIAAGDLARVYANGVTPTDLLSQQAITVVGGSQPHENMMPTLCVSFIISLFGIFPSQT